MINILTECINLKNEIVTYAEKTEEWYYFNYINFINLLYLGLLKI